MAAQPAEGDRLVFNCKVCGRRIEIFLDDRAGYPTVPVADELIRDHRRCFGIALAGGFPRQPRRE